MTIAMLLAWKLVAATSLLIEIDAAEIFASKVLRAQKLQRDILHNHRKMYNRPMREYYVTDKLRVQKAKYILEIPCGISPEEDDAAIQEVDDMDTREQVDAVHEWKYGNSDCELDDIYDYERRTVSKKKHLRQREQRLAKQLPHKGEEAVVIDHLGIPAEVAEVAMHAWRPSDEELFMGDPSGRHWYSNGKKRHNNTR